MIFFISGETLIFSLVGENAKTTQKIDRFFGANLGENSGILRQNTVETRLKSRKSSTDFFADKLYYLYYNQKKIGVSANVYYFNL